MPTCYFYHWNSNGGDIDFLIKSIWLVSVYFSVTIYGKFSIIYRARVQSCYNYFSSLSPIV